MQTPEIRGSGPRWGLRGRLVVGRGFPNGYAEWTRLVSAMGVYRQNPLWVTRSSTLVVYKHKIRPMPPGLSNADEKPNIEPRPDRVRQSGHRSSPKTRIARLLLPESGAFREPEGYRDAGMTMVASDFCGFGIT
jgi:hypothetical protein